VHPVAVRIGHVGDPLTVAGVPRLPQHRHACDPQLLGRPVDVVGTDGQLERRARGRRGQSIVDQRIVRGERDRRAAQPQLDVLDRPLPRVPEGLGEPEQLPVEPECRVEVRAVEVGQATRNMILLVVLRY